MRVWKVETCKFFQLLDFTLPEENICMVINLSEKKAWSFTGSFRNNTAMEIVENICIVKQLACEIKADTIFIK